MVFVDTSAFYAVLDRDDSNHSKATDEWTNLLSGGAVLFTTSYVLLETAALLQNRIGIAALKGFQEVVVPLIEVDWVTAERHRSGMEAVLTAARRKLSLVDCISFQSMRDRGVQTVFCFDAHFRDQGFEIRP